MRLYNPAIGKFLSVDPIANEYPFYSPYHFAGNSPVMKIDLDGLEPATPARFSTTGVLTTPAIDNIRIQNHPAFLPKVAPSRQVYPTQPTIDVPSDEKLRQAIIKNNVEVLKVVVADPQKLREGDPWEWAGVLPIAKSLKLVKGLKLLKYSDEVTELVQETGKISERAKETITVLKEGKRTFGNAKKVLKDVLGDLGDDATDYVSRTGEGHNPFYGKTVGKSSADGKRYWRLDWDAEKGAHVNWVNGKEKGAILIGGDLEQAKRIVDNQVVK
jgi:hypothetical protein